MLHIYYRKYCVNIIYLCKERLKLTQPKCPGNLPKFVLIKKVCTNSYRTLIIWFVKSFSKTEICQRLLHPEFCGYVL